jgi:predicted nucleic acid-binding protein
LLEAWVVATRPRDVNGFGYSAELAAEGLAKIKRLFHLLPDGDDVYPEWERLVSDHRVTGKAAYDTRLVATMKVHRIQTILTFNVSDFRRYRGIQIIHPDEVLSGKP